MIWCESHKYDPRALPLADRHYNRRKPGSPQFAPPGRAVILLAPNADAVWITSWPFAQYVRHDWAGAWVNSLFRNESAALSSDLIRQAIAATLSEWPVGFTRKEKLFVLQILPGDMPAPEPYIPTVWT